MNAKKKIKTMIIYKIVEFLALRLIKIPVAIVSALIGA